MRFGAYRADSISATIESALPPEVLIPIGIPKGDALVAEGDPIKTGQPLVPDDLISPRQFHLSTVTGHVDRFISHGKGMRAPTSVAIARSGDDLFWEKEYDLPADAAAARLLMIRSGVIHACGEEIGRWLLGKTQNHLKALVVAGLSTSPLGSSGIGAVEEDVSLFSAGLSLWQTAASGTPVSIAVTEEEIERWRAAGVESEQVHIKALPNRYPYENPVILACAHLQKDLPGETNPLNEGILVIDTASVLAAGRIMTSRRPLIETRLELLGEGAKNTVAVLTRIGACAGGFFEPLLVRPSKLVAGGLLAGEGLTDDQPLLPHYHNVVALPLPERRFMGFAMPAATRHSWTRTVLSSLLPRVRFESKAEVGGEERPCISCGACEEVCPRGISPSYLFKVADADIIEEMELYGIDRCIQCGLCSYVCPSKIDLMGKIVAGLKRLEAERAE